MRNQCTGIVLAILAFCCIPVFVAKAAETTEVTSSVYNSRETEGIAPLGLGVMSGQLQGETGYSFIAQGERHLSQREGRLGFREYGEHASRISAGQGVGVAMQATTGITLVGLDAHEHVFPHIGFEIFSGQFAISSDSAAEKYYEWLPTMSVGIQSSFGSCRFLPLARAGGGAGNLGKPGIAPALGTVVGVGAYLDCAALDFSVEAGHLNAVGGGTDFSRADLSIPLAKGASGIDLRGEKILEPNRLEQRVSLVFKSRLMGLLF
jgi:hypothetical protein